MNIRIDEKTLAESELALMKFGVGQPVSRMEDPVLLRGEGDYTDDVAVAGAAHAAIVRSPYAHGVIRAVDLSAARAMPGVLGCYAADDLAGYGQLGCNIAFSNRDGTPMPKLTRPALARERVRYVGDPVAFVVAETALQAHDAAEAVVLEIEALPAVTDAREAAAPDAPRLYDEVAGNVPLDFHFGDSAKVAAAFEGAAHVTTLRLRNNRIVVNAMEPRGAIASHDPASGRFTLQLGTQGVWGMRGAIAGVLGMPPESIRILTGRVGGSFGMKAGVYPEYVCLLHAARALGRPVRWTDRRSESFMSDAHGRDHDVEASLALDADGQFLALRVEGFGNLGASFTGVGPMMFTANVAKNMVSVYRTPLVEVNTRAVFTNTTPVGPYRGAGRPEGNYYMERLIDAAAAETGIDRVELRRRNLIPAGEMPYEAGSGMHYDSGDFPRVLDTALDAADWDGFAARKADSASRGKLRGLGLACFLEVTAPPTNEMGGIHFEKDGTVTILTGTLDYGQGHASPFAQVLVEKLGVPFDRIRLVQGDSARLIAGGGTGGSKSIMASGAAISEAGDIVIENGRRIAAHVLEAGVDDVGFARGRFTIAGTDRGIGIMDLAGRIASGLVLPPDLPATLDVEHIFKAAPAAFPNGCHVAEVEIDPDTGVVSVVGYSSANDFGVIVNPLLVEGQVHGGVVQGIGQALLEETVYDESGQLVSGSYMDYALPRADNSPSIAFHSAPSPAATNVLGVKGCGEAGCAGALPSVMNAVVDALREHGVSHLDMPATPHRVWRAMHAGAGG